MPLASFRSFGCALSMLLAIGGWAGCSSGSSSKRADSGAGGSPSGGHDGSAGGGGSGGGVGGGGGSGGAGGSGGVGGGGGDAASPSADAAGGRDMGAGSGGASGDGAANVDAPGARDAGPDGAGSDAPGGGPDVAQAPCNPGPAWTIVDDYVHSDMTMQTNPSGLSSGRGGELLATGIAVRMGEVFGIVRKSADGQSWSLLKEMTGGLGSGTVAVASDGTMFGSGQAVGGAGRVVHRSKDNGLNWQPVDTVTFAPGTPCNTGHVAVDSKGVVFSAGSCDTEGWRVRRSTNGGDGWSPVGDPFKLAGPLARMADLHIDGEDRVFVSGTAQDASGGGHWIVRRLGANDMWTTVDDYLPQAGASTNSPHVTGSRRLYAMGTYNSPTGDRWIVRRADAGGSNWTTIDDWASPGAMNVAATGVYEGPAGQLIAVGSVTDASSVTRMITRRSTDDGKSWTGTEEWTYSPGKASSSGELIADARGNVYVTVRGVDANNRAHWLVRKLACAP